MDGYATTQPSRADIFNPVAGYVRRWTTKYGGAIGRPGAVAHRRAALLTIADEIQALGQPFLPPEQVSAAFGGLLEQLVSLNFHLPAELQTGVRRVFPAR